MELAEIIGSITERTVKSPAASVAGLFRNHLCDWTERWKLGHVIGLWKTHLQQALVENIARAY